jgi:hypothetical protein
MAEGSLIDDAKTIGFHRTLTLYSSGGPFIDAYVLSIIGVALTQAEAPLGLGSVETGLIGASARWLLFKGRVDEAHAVVRQVYGEDARVDDLPEEEEVETDFAKVWRQPYLSRWCSPASTGRFRSPPCTRSSPTARASSKSSASARETTPSSSPP